MNDQEMRVFLEKRIKHAQQRVDELKISHGDNPNNKFNYYAGASYGYWKGLLSAYYNMFDEIEERDEEDVFKIGIKVKVMYPYDAGWWETRGVVVEVEDENVKVKRYYDGEMVSIHKEYLEYA